jgi:hypothetical protein
MADKNNGLDRKCLAAETTLQGPHHAPYIPPEIHRLITKNIFRSDLPNYRLVTKTLAGIGAEQLFGTTTIPLQLNEAWRASTPSSKLDN